MTVKTVPRTKLHAPSTLSTRQTRTATSQWKSAAVSSVMEPEPEVWAPNGPAVPVKPSQAAKTSDPEESTATSTPPNLVTPTASEADQREAAQIEAQKGMKKRNRDKTGVHQYLDCPKIDEEKES